MKLLGILFKGDEIDDISTFNALPKDLQVFYKEVNGLIAYKGGLHIRGCCNEPFWHSIKEIWVGKLAFWKHYPDILDIDVPFAQDCLGDQFLIRNNKVIKLSTESGEVDFLELDLWGFFEEIEKDPVNFLGMHPLIQFSMEGGEWEVGKILSAYPPFVLNQTGEVSLKAQPIKERLEGLSDLFKKISRLKDGDDVQFIVD